MKIIDLSQPLYTGMWVYPGDPEVQISQILFLDKDGWNMSRIEINSHDGTHVNVPIHSEENGKNLDDYTLEDFMGVSLIYENEQDLQKGVGVIFVNENISQETAEKIVKNQVKFVGLSDRFEFDIEVERYLLKHGIISFERLANCASLPKKFFFHGTPLKIQKGDGSPVRAYALCYDTV